MQIEDERIDIVKNWLEPKLVINIQVFIGFVKLLLVFHSKL